MLTDTDFGDLELIERRAYQDGNMVLARITAIAADTPALEHRIEELEGSVIACEMVIEAIRDILTESNWRTGKKSELVAILDNIDGEANAISLTIEN